MAPERGAKQEVCSQDTVPATLHLGGDSETRKHGGGREVTEREPGALHPPLPGLAAAPNPSNKSWQYSALCLLLARVQKTLLYQPEQINKIWQSWGRERGLGGWLSTSA